MVGINLQRLGHLSMTSSCSLVHKLSFCISASDRPCKCQSSLVICSGSGGARRKDIEECSRDYSVSVFPVVFSDKIFIGLKHKDLTVLNLPVATLGRLYETLYIRSASYMAQTNGSLDSAILKTSVRAAK